MTSFLHDKSVLITGGTGSIGSELVRQSLRQDPKRVIVFSRDDSKHYYLQQELRDQKNVEFIIGDVRDPNSLSRAFNRGVDVVLHAAALKHVAISEQNPTEAVKTNILGTQNLVDLAIAHGIDRMVTISTDKAVNPSCTMGASKYIAEKLTIAANRTTGAGQGPAFSCVRFGNVFGSRGSVIPSFSRSLRTSNALYVSDPKVTRFAITIEEAAGLVLRSLALARGGEIFVLKMRAFRLQSLIEIFAAGVNGGPRPRVEKLGLSPGEKLHEELVTVEEAARLYENDDFYVILSPDGGAAPEPGLRLKRSRLERVRSDEVPKIPKQQLRRLVDDAIANAID